MVFTFSKISNHGTSNPVIARAQLQIHELLEKFNLEEHTREAVFGIYLEKVSRKLLKCWEIKQDLEDQTQKIEQALADKGLPTQSHGNAVELPHIEDLEGLVETFLYNAKSTLRDLALIFDPLFGKSFNHSRYNEIGKWAMDNFGESSQLAKLILTDEEWINELVKKRNAIEHPGGYSGILHIHNYSLINMGTIQQRNTLVPPTWHRNDAKPSHLANDLSVYFENLLTFSEDILVNCLFEYGSKFPVVVYEVPEEERNPSKPFRLQVDYDLSKLT